MGDRGLPGGFCSRYTMAGSYAATHLVLHGLWADYGAIYDHEPKPPLYNGSYQVLCGTQMRCLLCFAAAVAHAHGVAVTNALCPMLPAPLMLASCLTLSPLQPRPPPPLKFQRQSWPQYCDGASRCAVVGGACPWPDARGTNFTQHEYEECMRQQHVRGCTVRHRVLRELKHTLAWLAPGYLGSNGTFIDHEWFKHGTCECRGRAR